MQPEIFSWVPVLAYFQLQFAQLTVAGLREFFKPGCLNSRRIKIQARRLFQENLLLGKSRTTQLIPQVLRNTTLR